jgi:hypothetical protein
MSTVTKKVVGRRKQCLKMNFDWVKGRGQTMWPHKIPKITPLKSFCDLYGEKIHFQFHLLYIKL